MSTYVIGDVQGCFIELNKLLRKIDFNEKKDNIWFVGDIINRGPDSLKTITFIKNLSDRKICNIVLGNHELHLLCVYYGYKKINSSDTFIDIIKSGISEEIILWLRNQKFCFFNNKKNFFVSHAGIYPYWSVKEAVFYSEKLESILKCDSKIKIFLKYMYGNYPNNWAMCNDEISKNRMIVNIFTRMRLCDENGSLDFSKNFLCENTKLIPWFKLRSSYIDDNINIIFGHWSLLNGLTGIENFFAMDTGCVWGNYLSALRIEDKSLFSVKKV